MKTVIASLFLLITYNIRAQIDVYFNNGNKMNADIQSYQDAKFKMQIKRGENVVASERHRDHIALLFKGSSFLVVSTLAALSEAEAAQQVNDFIQAPSTASSTDLLIKALPTQVIVASISEENEEIVNYVDENKNSASIHKNELVAIIRKNGTYELLKEYSEAASLLASVKNTVEQLSKQKSTLELLQPIEPPKPIENSNTDTPPIVNILPKVKNKPTLTEPELDEYRQTAKRKVDYFYEYLNVIVDKSRSKSEKDNAVEEAAKLFMPNSLIEVDSDNKSGLRRYPVREYLKRLQLLPYSKANIAWSEVQYIKDLTQEKDGNYYGIIRGQQTFTG
ncbi:MAG: hypothetical protein ACK41O_10465, partial [Runella zeae]